MKIEGISIHNEGCVRGVGSRVKRERHFVVPGLEWGELPSENKKLPIEEDKPCGERREHYALILEVKPSDLQQRALNPRK